MTTRADIVRVAREWMNAKPRGTRWHHQASLKGVGCDCIGLIAGVAAECGIAEAMAWERDPLRRCYGKEPDPSMLLRASDSYMERIAVGFARLADVFVFHSERDSSPRHFGIISAEKPFYVIHAYAQARRVVENRIDDVWRSRIVRAYRFRGLDG